MAYTSDEKMASLSDKPVPCTTWGWAVQALPCPPPPLPLPPSLCPPGGFCTDRQAGLDSRESDTVCFGIQLSQLYGIQLSQLAYPQRFLPHATCVTTFAQPPQEFVQLPITPSVSICTFGRVSGAAVVHTGVLYLPFCGV